MAIAYRKYVAAIIFRQTKQGPRFLILRRKQNWKGWEYVKGGLLPGEKEAKALKREIWEETGAKKFKVIAKLPKKIKYTWPKTFRKDSKKWKGAIQTVYLVELSKQKIRLDKKEHNGYGWVPAKQALKLLTYKESKSSLAFAVKNYF